MNTLSELVNNSRQLIPKTLTRENTNLYFGDQAGKCVICGKHWDAGGFTPRFGGNFTSYELLQSGDIVCPYCYQMQQSQDYRRNMYLVSPEEWYPFKKAEGKQVLLSEKPVPFVLYYTRTWKKQGWYSLMNMVNESNTLFFVGLDYDIITVDIDKARTYFRLIEELRELKISKTEIETGHYKPASLEKLRMDLDRIKMFKEPVGDPLWGLCVFLNE